MAHPGARTNAFAKKEYSRVPFIISGSINNILGRAVSSGTLERNVNLKMSFHSTSVTSA